MIPNANSFSSSGAGRSSGLHASESPSSRTHRMEVGGLHVLLGVPPLFLLESNSIHSSESWQVHSVPNSASRSIFYTNLCMRTECKSIWLNFILPDNLLHLSLVDLPGSQPAAYLQREVLGGCTCSAACHLADPGSHLSYLPCLHREQDAFLRCTCPGVGEMVTVPSSVQAPHRGVLRAWDIPAGS